MRKAKSTFVRQITELEDPVPRDFDPEADENGPNSEDESEIDDGLAGTEHYAEVGKSELRKPEDLSLGPKYAGSRVTREALLNDDDEEDGEEYSESNSEEETGPFAELADFDMDVDEEDGDIESDGAFGDSDGEKFEDFTFSGSGKPKDLNGTNRRPTAADFMSDSKDEGVKLNGDGSDDEEIDEDILDVDMQHRDESEDEDDDSGPNGSTEDQESGASQESESDGESEEASEDEDDKKARRAELRKIMGEEQQTVVATISRVAKADAAKGSAVRWQRKAFDSLLSVRMVLQKALIATNSMAAIEDKDTGDASNQPYEAAEEAAIKLWNMLDGLRHEILRASGAKTGQKRKRGIDISTVSSIIWERIQNSEISMIDTRQTTLDKWSAKVRGTTALPLSRKLNPIAPQQSITSMLQDQLASSDHLMQRTKIPRSCAPAQRDAKLTEDPNIYDDGNFYQLLLKELVDQRRVDSLSAPVVSGEVGKALQWIAVKEAKTRKNIDTKASKGRKMRYTVHEKLQNFMAPEDRGSWEPGAVDRLFGMLLGQKMTLGEDNTREKDVDVSPEEEGLMLFRS